MFQSFVSHFWSVCFGKFVVLVPPYLNSILIDYLTPSGHVPIINFYIKHLNKNFKFIFLNRKIKEKINKVKKIKYFNFKNNLFLKTYQLAKLFQDFKKQKIKNIVLLSYEPHILLLLGLFIDLDYFKIFVFEHDTLNPKKKFKFFIINFLNKNISHLVYNLNSKKLLIDRFKRKAIFTNHPIMKIINNESCMQNKKIALIPTRHHFNKNNIKNFVKKNTELKFNILSKKSNIEKGLFNNFKNVKLFEFIDEKDIKNISFIYLPIDEEVYKYRVSAWLYKGIAYNKKIFMENNSLYKFEKKRYPNNVFLNSKKNLTTKYLVVKKKVNIFKYNLLLINDLKKSILN